MRQLLRDYWILTRPRIVGLVLFTMAVAALAANVHVPLALLLNALLGTAGVIVGAVALNQSLEHRTDALMLRTVRRPLPAGRLTHREVIAFGVLASVAGLAYLVALVNIETVLLAAASWAIYVWVYTPLKPLTLWQTPLGAVAGAMPTLLGAAAAGTPRATLGWVMFAVVFFWQFPHSMAIAWIYRHEFAAAKLKVATVVDPSGRTAAWIGLAGAAALVVVGIIPTLTGRLGWGYGVTALALSGWYLAAALDFLLHTNDRAARRLLRVSIVYLTVLLLVLLIAARL
jgi:protoheme IX farnesyltransferase